MTYVEPWPAKMIKALQQGDYEAVRLLVDACADINEKDITGNTMLGRAALRNDVVLAQLLLAKNADVEKTNGNASSPLGLAAANGHIEVIRLLLDAGADINRRDFLHGTAQDWAEERGFTETAEFLAVEVVRRRAAMEASVREKAQHDLAVLKQNAFKNMEQQRKMKNDQSLSSAFNAAPPPLAAEMDKALARSDTQAITALLLQDADPEQRDEYRNTQLMLAAINGDAALARLLISKNADLEKTNMGGHTALMLAAMNARLEITRLLIEAGADTQRLSTGPGQPRAALNYAESKRYAPVIWALQEAADIRRRRTAEMEKAATEKARRDALAEKQRALKNLAQMQKLRKPAA